MLSNNSTVVLRSQFKSCARSLQQRSAQRARQAADPFAPCVENTGFFAQNARYILKVGISEELVKAAFDLSIEKPVGTQAYEGQQTALRDSTEEPRKQTYLSLMRKRQTQKTRLLRQRQGDAVKNFVKQLGENAKVMVNASVIQYTAS